MTDKQNFQAVVNCASELPVASFMFPQVILLAGHDLPLSEMLRRVADHVEINNLNDQGHSVQVVRVPKAVEISESVIDLMGSGQTVGQVRVEGISATRVQTGVEPREVTLKENTSSVDSVSKDSGVSGLITQREYNDIIEGRLLDFLRSQGLAQCDTRLEFTPMGRREELLRNWLADHGLAHVLATGI